MRLSRDDGFDRYSVMGEGTGWSNRAGKDAYESRRDYIIAVKGKMRHRARASRRHFGESR